MGLTLPCLEAKTWICLGVFGVAPAPFCVALLFCLMAKRKSGREICGSSLVLVLVFLVFFLSVFASMMRLG